MGSRKTTRSASICRAAALIAAFVFAQHAVAESEYAANWGPSVGATAPLLSAVDQNDQAQNLETLKGTNGLLFVFNRSVNW